MIRKMITESIVGKLSQICLTLRHTRLRKLPFLPWWGTITPHKFRGSIVPHCGKYAIIRWGNIIPHCGKYAITRWGNIVPRFEYLLENVMLQWFLQKYTTFCFHLVRRNIVLPVIIFPTQNFLENIVLQKWGLSNWVAGAWTALISPPLAWGSFEGQLLFSLSNG